MSKFEAFVKKQTDFVSFHYPYEKETVQYMSSILEQVLTKLVKIQPQNKNFDKHSIEEALEKAGFRTLSQYIKKEYYRVVGRVFQERLNPPLQVVQRYVERDLKKMKKTVKTINVEEISGVLKCFLELIIIFYPNRPMFGKHYEPHDLEDYIHDKLRTYRLEAFLNYKGKSTTSVPKSTTSVPKSTKTNIPQPKPRKEYEKMKVVELKAILKDMGLSYTGKKADLVERISSHQGTKSSPLPKSLSPKSEKKKSFQDYEKMKVVELKVILKDMGLPISGKKTDLIERIIENEEKGKKVEKIASPEKTKRKSVKKERVKKETVKPRFSEAELKKPKERV